MSLLFRANLHLCRWSSSCSLLPLDHNVFYKHDCPKGFHNSNILFCHSRLSHHPDTVHLQDHSSYVPLSIHTMINRLNLPLKALLPLHLVHLNSFHYNGQSTNNHSSYSKPYIPSFPCLLLLMNMPSSYSSLTNSGPNVHLQWRQNEYECSVSDIHEGFGFGLKPL